MKQFLHHNYNIIGNPINTTHSHKDLGVIVSDNLNWNAKQKQPGAVKKGRCQAK